MRRRWGDGGICGVGKMAWWRNTDKKWRQKYKKTRKKNPKKSVCRRGGPICCNRQLWDYRQHRHQTMIVGDVCVSVQGGGAIMYYPPPLHAFPSPPLSLYPLRRPWWDTAFHLLIAVIGVCEGELHVLSSPSASVRELENGILWRAPCVCRPRPRWHIFIIRSVTEQISLSVVHRHTLWFAILKIIYIER